MFACLVAHINDQLWKISVRELPQSEGDLQLSSTPLAAQAAE